MVLTRGTIKNGPDGVRNAPNTDTPFVDQSQTYTSHASHQVFLREYVDNTAASVPVATGKFLSSPDGGLATWATIKAQAANLLGLELADTDVDNIPMIAADAYGKFIPGPQRSAPVRDRHGRPGRGQPGDPGARPRRRGRASTPPSSTTSRTAPDPGSIATPKSPGQRTPRLETASTPVAAGQYDDELLDLHFICGDGRCNENIALQAVHQVFHTEHDRLVGDIQNVLANDTTTAGARRPRRVEADARAPTGWNGERLFQAARFVTEMEYQHLVFEEFARKVQPAINPFEPFAFTQTDVNPAITAEFAHAVYRFGHSMLDRHASPARSPRPSRTGLRSTTTSPLLDGFLNPPAYTRRRHGGRLTSAGGRRRDRHGAVRPGRQRDRRVRHRDPAQQPARPAARPAGAQHDPRPQRGHPAAERRAPADLRRDQRRPAHAVHRLGRLRPAPQAPRVAGQLRRRLRHRTRPSPAPTTLGPAQLPSTRSSTARIHARTDGPATLPRSPTVVARPTATSAPCGTPTTRVRGQHRRRPTPADFMNSAPATWANTGQRDVQTVTGARRRRPVDRRPRRDAPTCSAACWAAPSTTCSRTS